MLDLDSILPAKTLEISRLSAKPGHLALPLVLNINDKATAFAGSIFSLAALSGYDMAFERQKELSRSGNLFLLSSHITYHQPGLSDLTAQSQILEDFTATKKANWKMLIRVEVTDSRNDILCAVFEGTYIIQVDDR